jgi:PAS domain S-box-containing protein
VELVPALVRKLDGEILLWGGAIEAIYGFGASEAEGCSVHALLATEYPRPLPEIETELLAKGVWQGALARTHRDGRRLTATSRWALYRHSSEEPG